MAAKQYYVPNMPEDVAHPAFHGLIAKLRAVVGVHDVTVDRTSKHVTVHMQGDDGYLPDVDAAILEFGMLPGFTGQV